MKIINTLCALLLSAPILVAAQTIPFTDGIITSTVTLVDNSFYLYEYVIDREMFRHDISHFTLDICDEAEIWNIASNVNFVEEFSKGTFKWDDIQSGNQPLQILFSFKSQNIPLTLGDYEIKSGRNYTYGNTYVPSCETIPEPNTAWFGAIGTFLLLRRKR